jgi:hypothetical protein
MSDSNSLVPANTPEDSIEFDRSPARELLPPLPPIPDWFVEHNTAPLHVENCPICRRNPNFDYDAYLRSAAWEIRRTFALEYYGARCCLCPATTSLQVHHRTYERIGAERLTDLIVLCRPCHARFHDKAA